MSSPGKDRPLVECGDEALEAVFATSAELCLLKIDQLHRNEEFGGYLVPQSTGLAALFVEVVNFFIKPSEGLPCRRLYDTIPMVFSSRAISF